MKRAVVAAIGLLVLVSCSKETVEPVYSYPAGTARYRLEATGAARWNVGGRDSGSYRISYRVKETIRRTGSGALVTLELTPTDVEQDKLLPLGSETRSFTLRLGAKGEVLEVVEVDGLPPRDLNPDELTLIAAFRPPLPIGAVAVRDRWRSDQAVELDGVSERLTTRGRLDALGVDSAGEFARLSYEGSGTLTGRPSFEFGRAGLEGPITTRGTGIFDLGGGFLRQGRLVTTARFEVELDRRRQLPAIVGTMRTELRVDVERLP